jgi:hypothetical protein
MIDVHGTCFVLPSPSFMMNHLRMSLRLVRPGLEERKASQGRKQERDILALTQGVPAFLYSSTKPYRFGLIRSIAQLVRQMDDTQCRIFVVKSIIAERGQPWA